MSYDIVIVQGDKIIKMVCGPISTPSAVRELLMSLRAPRGEREYKAVLYKEDRTVMCAW